MTYEEIKKEIQQSEEEKIKFWEEKLEDAKNGLPDAPTPDLAERRVKFAQKKLENLDEYAKQEIMRQAVRLAERGNYDEVCDGWFSDEQSKYIIDKCLRSGGRFALKTEFLDYVSDKYDIGVKYMASASNDQNYRFERSKPEKKENETEDQFLDRQEKYDLEMCALGQPTTFSFQNDGINYNVYESDVKKMYQEKREQLAREKIELENKERERQLKEQQEKELQAQQQKMQEELKQREAQAKHQREVDNWKKLNPFKKFIYKHITKKAVKENETWIVPETNEVENGRSFK